MEQVKELLDKRDVLDKINEYLNQFNQVDQYEICNAIGYLYEEIRRLPTHSSLNGHIHKDGFW